MVGPKSKHGGRKPPCGAFNIVIPSTLWAQAGFSVSSRDAPGPAN